MEPQAETDRRDTVAAVADLPMSGADAAEPGQTQNGSSQGGGEKQEVGGTRKKYCHFSCKKADCHLEPHYWDSPADRPTTGVRRREKWYS